MIIKAVKMFIGEETLRFPGNSQMLASDGVHDLANPVVHSSHVISELQGFCKYQTCRGTLWYEKLCKGKMHFIGYNSFCILVILRIFIE